MGVVMDMKKYNVLALFTVVFLVACHGELEREDRDDMIPMSFYANIETPKDSISTRTVLGGESSDSYRNVLWEYQDEIFVTNGAVSSRFVNVTEGKSEVALLEGELSQASTYYAAYPYGMVKSYSASGFKIELPSVQNYCHDGVSSDSFPMVAKSEGGMFSFRNLCGIFVLRLIGDDTISSVTFSGKDISGKDISVAGNGTISMDYSISPSLLMEESAFKSVTLRSTEGVRLSPTHPTTFHIVLPVGIYNTFTVTITATDGSVMRIESEKALEIERSNRTSAASLSYSGVIHYQDLNEYGETANSYIISAAGDYKFKAVKGNSGESVGTVSSVEVLWESFGTNVTPFVGDLVKNVAYKDGHIQFSTQDTFKEGNAVIAVKDASGTILWSWHIWLTDQPEEQVYYNNAGTMMDRNLGATSATPGDVGSRGLLYQWGRKDPFPGSASTGFWPSVESNSSVGTVDFVISHPMTFVGGVYSYYNYEFDYDWHYSYRDNKLWNTSQGVKSLYDPCPTGWRVPDGGPYGVWAKALGSSSYFTEESLYDSRKGGLNLSGKLGSDEVIWYPLSGFFGYLAGEGDVTRTRSDIGIYGCYWSASTSPRYADIFCIACEGFVNPTDGDSSHCYRASGYSVRCVKEGSWSEPPSDPATLSYKDISILGTANSYIISVAGDYKFKAVKGNSGESVGTVSSVETLWESVGTDVTPSIGDLIRNVSYSDGYIRFSTPPTFKEGNAVIAAKDASGTILWSWHIWITDQPQEQVYYNNAGTMMDRNLGATSATPGDVGSLGLLYQWGRKDPFLGSASIHSSVVAKSTGSWQTSEYSNLSAGTVGYVVSHPMTFVKGRSDSGNDWHYAFRDNTLWTTSPNAKSIYDPCPIGWRVPDGGRAGVWSKALGFSYSISAASLYDSTNIGVNLSGMFGSDTTIWYPIPYFIGSDGALDDARMCNYLSASGDGSAVYSLCVGRSDVLTTTYVNREFGQSVRCLKE